MKKTADTILTYLLTPLSWIYGAVVYVRNKLFDKGIFLKETEYSIPIVSVGNITVGGTGKTPHVEYIVRHLSESFNIAVLSRGYKRKTKGFILANSKTTPELIGDEPMQIYNKFGFRIKVAVCEDRREGIRQLCKLFPDLDLILLDDAFQHRWVKPKVSILLTEYNRPFYKDKLLPLGRLRESAHAVNRADMVIITKVPDNIMPIDFRIKSKELSLMSFQQLFFSKYNELPLQPVFTEDAPYHASLSTLTHEDSVLLLTGIAHPRQFVRQFRKYPFKVKVQHFPDHHDFSRRDIDYISKKFNELSGRRKLILTTEKDAVRLAYNPYFPKELKPFIFYQPVEVIMLNALENKDFIQELRKAITRDSQF